MDQLMCDHIIDQHVGAEAVARGVAGDGGGIVVFVGGGDAGKDQK